MAVGRDAASLPELVRKARTGRIPSTRIEAKVPDAASVAESAWMLHQKLAREDYIGDEPDLNQLRRDLSVLALLLHALVEGDDVDV